MKTFEVTGAGFNGETDETDDQVVWIEAESREEVLKAIAGTGALLHGEVEGLLQDESNYTIPEQLAELREELQKFQDKKNAARISNSPLRKLASTSTERTDRSIRMAMLANRFSLLGLSEEVANRGDALFYRDTLIGTESLTAKEIEHVQMVTRKYVSIFFDGYGIVRNSFTEDYGIVWDLRWRMMDANESATEDTIVFGRDPSISIAHWLEVSLPNGTTESWRVEDTVNFARPRAALDMYRSQYW